MAKRIGGMRRKTRSEFTKPRRNRGKISLRYYFQEFAKGDNVILAIEPAVQKGMYHPRFADRPGTIIAKQGECYKVQIKDIHKPKHLIVHPVHLRPAGVYHGA